MWKTLEELEKYLYMSQDETLRRVGQSLVTLVEQEIEARVDDKINEACEEARDEGYRDGLGVQIHKTILPPMRQVITLS